MGLTAKPKTKKKNKEIRRYPEIMIPGEKVQIDVKEVPFNCLRGANMGQPAAETYEKMHRKSF